MRFLTEQMATSNSPMVQDVLWIHASDSSAGLNSAGLLSDELLSQIVPLHSMCWSSGAVADLVAALFPSDARLPEDRHRLLLALYKQFPQSRSLTRRCGMEKDGSRTCGLWVHFG